MLITFLPKKWRLSPPQNQNMADRSQRKYGHKSTIRPGVVLLEDRTCPSVFYDFDIVAQTGGNFTNIQSTPSINDSGHVAFIASTSAGQSVYVDKGSSPPQIISFPSPSTQETYGPEFQINNSGQVATIYKGGDTVNAPEFAYIWDSKTPGTNTLVGRRLSGSNLSGGGFDDLLSFSSMTNDGQLAFAGLELDVSLPPSAGSYEIHLADGTPEVDRVDQINDLPTGAQSEVATLPDTTFFRFMAADGDRVVVGSRGATKDIVLYDTTGINTSGTIATTAGGQWGDLGIRPGISDDGSAVVFYGDKGDGSGLGIYAHVRQGTNPDGFPIISEPILIAGANGVAPRAELGFAEPATISGGNTTPSPIFFLSSDFSIDSRPGVVVYQDPNGDPDAFEAGEKLVVSFLGKPNASSRANPLVPSKPLTFSDQLGLWTVEVRVEPNLGAPGKVSFNTSGAIPVAQVGETINGSVITGLALGDSIAQVATDANGAARTVQRGDHQLAFHATTAVGSMIVHGRHLDSDTDGLPDHWETRGVDIDLDGVVDLNLAAMDADPLKRDLFLEIDHLVPRTTGFPIGWTNQLAPGVTAFLDNMFASAPALENGVQAGITLHLDAGGGNDALDNPLSVNMGAGSLQGGDEIGQPGLPNQHIDVVYFGLPGSVNLQGVETRAFDDIKRSFFGTADKAARELVFHYAVFADFHSFIGTAEGVPFTAAVTGSTENILTSAIPLHPGLPGHLVKITAGTGAGQVRSIRAVANDLVRLRVSPNWDTVPDTTSQFTLINGSSGLGETYFRPNPDLNAIPGNDLLLTLGGFGVNSQGWLANAYIQQRTLGHELGHTLGLRHGGIDHNPYKGNNYLSLMNYSHQLATPSTVNSYSGAGDKTFNDWENLRLDFQKGAIHIGNSFVLPPAGEISDDPENTFTVSDFQTLNGAAVDLTTPTVEIVSLVPNQAVVPGKTLTINIQATDDFAVEFVKARFDVNGNGDSDIGEVVSATPLGGGVFQANFSTVGGTAGPRMVQVIGSDASGNADLATVTLTVTDGSNAPPKALGELTSTIGNKPVVIDVLANDTDTGGFIDSTTVTVFGSPKNGLTSVNSTTGAITFTPDAGFNGTASFTYFVKDNGGLISNPATVTVQVNNLKSAVSPVVVGSPGGSPQGSTVSIVDPATGKVTGTVVPFPNFQGEVRVAAGDLNKDGKMETIAAAGPGGGPAINIIDSTGKTTAAFFAFDPAFSGGVFISVSDVNNDGFADIIAGAGEGGGPHVKIFNGKDFSVLGSFFAFAEEFRGGVSVASADINGDGILDVVTGAGPSGGPHVKVFDGKTNSLISQWFAYASDFTGGVFVAVGDIGNDGKFEVVTGAGVGGGPVVAVFNPLTGALQKQFLAYDESFTGGVRVGVSDGNADGVADLVTGAGPGGGPHVKGFNFPQLDLLFQFFSGPADDNGGVFVN